MGENGGVNTEATAEAITRALVAVPSPSHSEGERTVADLLRQHGSELGWQPLTGQLGGFDDGNAFLFIEGPSRDTIILTGHHDTVGFTAYSHLGGPDLACNPDALAAHFDYGPDWMLGRGVFDMKSGLAAHLVAGKLASEAGLPCSLLFASFADEEGLSRGARRGAGTIAGIGEALGLRFIAAINSDICPMRWCCHYPVWFGSVGKANVLFSLSISRGHAGDRKGVKKATVASEKLLAGMAGCPVIRIWNSASDGFSAGGELHVLTAITWRSGRAMDTLAQLLFNIRKATGLSAQNSLAMIDGNCTADQVAAKVEQAAASTPSHEPRLFYSLLDPFYHCAPPSDWLKARVKESLRGFRWLSPRYLNEFPLVSDLSFLWGVSDDLTEQGVAACLIQHPDISGIPDPRLRIPSVNIGPLGADAHLATERIERGFTFRDLPQLIASAIASIGRSA